MLERLQNLEENIANLRQMRKTYTLEDMKKNKFDEWALRYGLFESIQIIIDLSCHLAAEYNLGVSKTYVECIEKLEKFEYINAKLTKNLIASIGLRNMLIHEYVKIDIERLYGYLEFIEDFSDFVKAISENIDMK